MVGRPPHPPEVDRCSHSGTGWDKGRLTSSKRACEPRSAWKDARTCAVSVGKPYTVPSVLRYVRGSIPRPRVPKWALMPIFKESPRILRFLCARRYL